MQLRGYNSMKTKSLFFVTGILGLEAATVHALLQFYMEDSSRC